LRSNKRAALFHAAGWVGILGVIVLLWVLIFMAVGCTRYNPALFPSYDILTPGPEVRLNPKGFTADGDLIVNAAFLLWVDELKNEIIKLRKKGK
jgi:hypothetical protein